MTVTNHMLRKLLADVNIESRSNVRGLSTNINANTGDTNGSLFFEEKTIEKVQGNYLFAKDGTKAKLLSPLPSLKWVCLGVANDKGIIFLEKPFKALIIGDGENNYCLGVDGDTNEFQLSVEVGDNIISINKLFINIQTAHEIKNGVER